TDSDTDNNSDTDDVSLTPKGDLSITKTDNIDSGTVKPGDSITYTVTVSNSGPSTATGATVMDTLPGTLTNGMVVSAVTAGGASIDIEDHTGGSINDVVTLPSGGSIVYTITATNSALVAGTLSNSATVTAPNGFTDTDPDNNTDTDDVQQL